MSELIKDLKEAKETKDKAKEAAAQAKLDQIISYDEQFYLPCFGKRVPLVVDHGRNVYLYGTDGKKYMDMIGGIAVNTLGHNNGRLTRAISSQARKVIHCCNYYYNEPQTLLAKKLVEKSFADKVFFANSGAEANEGAIKLARGYWFHKGTPKPKIITATMSFHGRTMATIAATGQEKFRTPFGPNLPGFEYVPYNDINALKSAIDGETGAIMLELIQGESGVHPADFDYVQAVRKLCTENKILLIIDEVQTGIGRTGTLFAYEQYGIQPDIMTLAKGLAGGVPIGAVLANKMASTGFAPGDHGSTFGGNPLACAAGLAVLEEIESKNLLGNVNTVSAYLQKKLANINKKTKKIAEVRGKGFLLGIELDSGSASEVKMKLFEKGFLVSAIGSNVIRIAPPLILSRFQAIKFTSALQDVLQGKE
ncbi:MAG: aspartate aminotransferase family protein [Clostridiales bacterium]|nr:aspartate aminotransferase family protein [Clostridiales bacterium]